jgi:hypothetical protein
MKNIKTWFQEHKRLFPPKFYFSKAAVANFNNSEARL